jgi:hypothetical protein
MWIIEQNLTSKAIVIWNFKKKQGNNKKGVKKKGGEKKEGEKKERKKREKTWQRKGQVVCSLSCHQRSLPNLTLSTPCPMIWSTLPAWLPMETDLWAVPEYPSPLPPQPSKKLKKQYQNHLPLLLQVRASQSLQVPEECLDSWGIQVVW